MANSKMHPLRVMKIVLKGNAWNLERRHLLLKSATVKLTAPRLDV